MKKYVQLLCYMNYLQWIKDFYLTEHMFGYHLATLPFLATLPSPENFVNLVHVFKMHYNINLIFKEYFYIEKFIN